MADTVETTKVKTKDELLADLSKAMADQDWKSISSLSTQISKMVKAEETAETEAKQKALKGITEKVMKTIEKAIKPMIDAGELDVADGVWFSYDFGEALTDCRLLKSVKVAKTGGGGGGGKKYDIKTSELLAKFGDTLMKDSDQTFNQAYEGNTDGNYRYGLRNKMLKLNGMS